MQKVSPSVANDARSSGREERPEDAVEAPPNEAEAMAALDRARLPVSTLAEAIPHLRRPFTPEAIRFKVQSVFKGNAGCLIVAYIDQRLVSERLNRVIPDKWAARFEFIQGTKLAWCRLTVDGVTREDIGESTKGLSKDLVSDALKRAAVPFGVGVSCYALPQIKLMMRDSHGRIEIRGPEGKQTIALTEHGMIKLREGYAKWLAEHGVQRFGPPLDHGDVVGATIEEDIAVGTGTGDGTEPEWEGLSAEAITDIEGVIFQAAERGWTLDRGAVKMRLNHQSDEIVAAWVADTYDQLHKRPAPEPDGEPWGVEPTS